MKTLIKECYKCGESDYTSNLYIYDNRYYCNICADEIEAKIIDEFQGINLLTAVFKGIQGEKL